MMFERVITESERRAAQLAHPVPASVVGELPEGCPETMMYFDIKLEPPHLYEKDCEINGCTPVELHPTGTRAILARYIRSGGGAKTAEGGANG